jgi:cytochrome b
VKTTAMSTPAQNAVLVWDLPVRVFHWLLVFSFAGAFLTAESERWAVVHITLGYTVAALVPFRLVWGLVGTRTARFASFVRGPAAVWRYLKSLTSGTPQHHVGHNPAGALAIVALLGLAAVVTASGWLRFKDIGPGWLEELHEGSANAMLLLVGLHVLAVVASGWLHRENLVRAMFSGRKPGAADQGIRRAWRPLGVLLLVGALGFWAWEWTHPPVAPDRAAAGSQERRLSGDNDND